MKISSIAQDQSLPFRDGGHDNSMSRELDILSQCISQNEQDNRQGEIIPQSVVQLGDQMQGGNNQLHLLSSPKIITIQDDNPHDSKDSSEDPRGDIRDDYTLINIAMNIDLNLESQTHC